MRFASRYSVDKQRQYWLLLRKKTRNDYCLQMAQLRRRQTWTLSSGNDVFL